jgi:hypothetical protein
MLHGQLDEERRRNTALFEENQRLREQLKQTQQELKTERQQRFCKDRVAAAKPVTPSDAPRSAGKRRGAPSGHPGWFRPQPTEWDRVIDVPAPRCCPQCGGDVRVQAHRDPSEHVQEDVVDGRRQVVLYRHTPARCRGCRRWVQQPGEGELLSSKVGPHARAMAAFLHHEIGVSARKVPRAVEGLTRLRFTASALLGFERQLAKQAKPLVKDIAGKISSTDGAVNADETYWSSNGKRSYFWLHATGSYVHFRFSQSRAGSVSRRILGKDFTGVLVSDCYSGYDAHPARARLAKGRPCRVRSLAVLLRRPGVGDAWLSSPSTASRTHPSKIDCRNSLVAERANAAGDNGGPRSREGPHLARPVAAIS